MAHSSTRFLLFALALSSRLASALLAGPELVSKALGKSGRPVVVHVWDPNPASLDTSAINDVSEACRTAGAAAVLCNLDLLEPISKEQERARGDFPGSLPVLSEMNLRDLIGPESLYGKIKSLGASGIGIRYSCDDWPDASALEEELQRAIAAANEAGLGAILLPEFGANGAEGAVGGGGLAARVGAAAGLAKTAEAGEDGEKRAFGCWDGEPEALQTLRDEGFQRLLLKNACRGDVAWGSKNKIPSLAALHLTRLIKASQSKGSTAIWGGASSGASGGGGGGGGALKPVQVPFELQAQMGEPAWSDKTHY